MNAFLKVAAIATLTGGLIGALPADAKGDGKVARDGRHAVMGAPVQGSVRQLLVNPYGEADGLLLDTGTIVRFPAHMSSKLMAGVRRGDAVTVQGRGSTGGDVRAYAIENRRSGRTIVAEQKPFMAVKAPKYVRYAALRPMTVQGTVAQVVHGKRGEVKAVVLDDGTTARLGRHLTYAMQAPLQPGTRVSFSGRGTVTAAGRGMEVETM